jgi:hypothetical protein
LVETGLFSRLLGDSYMSWFIGRTEAMADPLAARRKALAKL